MAYYNFICIFKNIVYNFRKIFKYLAICLLCITFIVICLLLISTCSSAVTIPQDVITQANSWNSNNYVILQDENDNFYIPKSLSSISSGNWTVRSIWYQTPPEDGLINPAYGRMQLFRYDGNNTFTEVSMNTWNSNSRIQLVNSSRSLRVVSSVNNVLNQDREGFTNGSIYFDPNFVAPQLFPNASTSQSEQDALTSGNFTFFIVDPR